MHFTRNQLADLRRKLNGARQEAIDSGHAKHSCKTQFIDPQTGGNYRLLHKPKGRRSVLEAAGHEVVDAARTPIGDVTTGLFVKVPLGEHGIDYLAIDPETGEISCALCRENKG